MNNDALTKFTPGHIIHNPNQTRTEPKKNKIETVPKFTKTGTVSSFLNPQTEFALESETIRDYKKILQINNGARIKSIPGHIIHIPEQSKTNRNHTKIYKKLNSFYFSIFKQPNPTKNLTNTRIF